MKLKINRKFYWMVLAAMAMVLSGCIKVTATDPEGGSKDVQLDKIIVINLSEDANPATVNHETLFVADDRGSSVPGDISCGSREIRFTPSGLLTSDTRYTVFLKSGIKDVFGQRLKEYSFSFTTVASTEPQTGELHVISVSPADSSVNVAFDACVRVNFGEPVLESSVGPKSFSVTDGSGNRVSGSYEISHDMRTVSFRPIKPFGFMSEYRVLLTQGIVGGNGARLKSCVTFSFMVEAEKKWTIPETVSRSTDVIYTLPDLAMDNNGNAIIAWSEDDGQHEWITVCEFRNGAWGRPERICMSDRNITLAKVVMNDMNEAIIIWSQWWLYDDGVSEDLVYGQEVMSIEYRNGRWNEARKINGIETYSTIAMDNRGDAVMIGTGFNDAGSAYVDKVIEYENGNWNSTPSKIIDGGNNLTSNTQLAVDDYGNAAVLWVEYNSQKCFSYIMERINGVWADAIRIDSTNIPSIIPIAYDYGELNALFSWSLGEGRAIPLTPSIYKARDNRCITYRLVKKGEDAMLLWRIQQGQYVTYSSEYKDGSWGSIVYATELAICGDDIWNAVRPFEADIDGRGNAVMAWAQRGCSSMRDSGIYRIYRNEYRNGVWDYNSVQISTAGKDADYPKVAMDKNGNVIIVWVEWNNWCGIMRTEYR